MSQHDKILELHLMGEWVCGNDYRREFIFSPHKRREEFAEKYQKTFEHKPCTHNSKNVQDYLLRDKKYPEEPYLVEYQPVTEAVSERVNEILTKYPPRKVETMQKLF